MESGPNTVLDDPTSLTIVQAAKAAMATDHPEVVGRLEALARQSERDVYVLKVAQQVLRGQPGSPWNSLSFQQADEWRRSGPTPAGGTQTTPARVGVTEPAVHRMQQPSCPPTHA